MENNSDFEKIIADVINARTILKNSLDSIKQMGPIGTSGTLVITS